MSKPRVLCVTTECSAEPRSGGEIRTHRLLQELCVRSDVRVVVISPTDGESLRRSLGASRVDVIATPSPRVVIGLRALARRWPITSSRWWRREVAKIVRHEASQGAIILLDHVYLDVYRPRRRRYVLSTHNVETRVQRTLPPPRSGASKALRGWELRMLERLERRAASCERTGVVAVSALDARALGPTAVVIENGADLPESPGQRPRGGHILFVGSMTWAPNREAVRWWLDEVRPSLRPDLPALTVVGRGGRAHFSSAEGLDVRDEVVDLAPVLRQATVVVVPLQHGGGTRLKVLEALAWQRPLVSTSKGVEGLRVLDGVHALLADDGRSFARAVEQLYDHDDLAARLTAAGAELVHEYDWRDLGRQFSDYVLSTGGG